jgi:hypothetical protein
MLIRGEAASRFEIDQLLACFPVPVQTGEQNGGAA